MTANIASESKDIQLPGQVSYLKTLLKDQDMMGRLTRADFRTVDYYKIPQKEYKKLLALTYNNKFRELEDMLFSLGAKGK